MIHRAYRKRHLTGVAGIALRGTWNMPRLSAPGYLAVVAGRATPNSRRVVEVLRSQPSHRAGMAGIALRGRRNMPLRFSRGRGAVVTGRTTAD